MDPDLKNAYSDLFSIGLEIELLPDFAIGATYVYKKQKDLIGLKERAGIYDQVAMVSPDNGQTYTLFNQINVGTVEHFITNPSDYEQTYQAVMLILYKRYSHNWMLNASLTYPWDILAGFNWIYQSGRPYLSFTLFRLNQGFRKVITESRGDDRFPAWSMMDLRLQKTFNIGDKVKFQAIFDVCVYSGRIRPVILIQNGH